LSTRAFSGKTTLPVSRNNNTNVIATISVSTMGSREVTARTVSRLIAAVPVSSACRPAGPRMACNRSSWVSEACENSGALLATVRNALPSLMAVAAEGGPTNLPATNEPSGADADDTSGTWDSCAA
jgi:hypothetical protein